MDVNRLMQISKENIDMMIKKNQDYSGGKGDNVTAGGVRGVGTRLLDKITRLNNLLENSDSTNFESIEDTLNDISNYGLIGRMVNEKSWQVLPSMVYLAGPIDDVSVDEAMGWREQFSNIVSFSGVSCYNPCGAFHMGRYVTLGVQQMVNINKMAIVNSDVVVANLAGTGKGIGTIREIEFAKSLGKRVLVVLPHQKEYSLYTYDLEIFESVKVAAYALVGVKDEYPDL